VGEIITHNLVNPHEITKTLYFKIASRNTQKTRSIKVFNIYSILLNY